MQLYELVDNTPVEVLGPGPLSKTFLLVKPEGQEPYLVWANTLRYRLDDKEDVKAVYKVK